MAPDKLENGGKHVMRWRLISWKMVPNGVLATFIAGYLYFSFFSLHFTWQSFQQV